MAIETDITKLVFNKMSQEKYEELKAKGELVNNEFYITPDSNIDIDIPENVVEADNYVNAKLWKGTLAEYKALESYDDSVTYIITDDVVEGGTIIDIDAYTKEEVDALIENIDLSDYVKNTDYATTSTVGLVKVAAATGINVNNEGKIYISKAVDESIVVKKEQYRPIVPANLDLAVKTGVTTNTIALTDEEKTVACEWLGADNSSLKKLNTTQITNCITEIPQDIKLEIDTNGKGVLKSGSKVYIPNGFEEDGTTLKFDEYIVSSDVIFNFDSSQTDTYFLALTSNGNGGWSKVNLAGSGTLTDTTDSFYYRTNENKIWYRNNDLDTATYSFPIGVVNITNGIGVINQVFNGFGYIGATTFALPGIKFLTPNGRNEDGTLNNIERTTEQVIINNYTYQTTNHQQWFISHNGQFRNAYYYEQDEEPTLTNASVWYSPSRNKMYWCNTIENGWKHITTVTMAADKINNDSNFNITSIDFKKPFTAIDKNETFWLSGLAMPSNKYMDLTLGATGTKYIAPANGWFALAKKSTSVGQYIQLHTPLYSTLLGAVSNITSLITFIPVSKGTNVGVYYTASGDTDYFRFIYAQGEK